MIAEVDPMVMGARQFGLFGCALVAVALLARWAWERRRR